MNVGCLSFFILVAVLTLPLHAIGLSDNASIIGGVILSVPVLMFFSELDRRRRVDEIAEAIRRAES